MLEGLDGKVKQEISAFTFQRVTGGMKVINKYKDKWSHTKGIQFPEPSSKKYIDILLRIDYQQFHTSIKENMEKWGSRCQTYLGLDMCCTARYPHNTADKLYQNISDERNWRLGLCFMQILGNWKSRYKYTICDDSRREKNSKVGAGFTYVQRWSIWGGDSLEKRSECLPDNYDMAVKRMINMERKLSRDGEIVNEYNQIIEG